MPGAIDPLYVAARRVLLDALDALGEQREAVVLVGAQAVYLHTGDSDLAVAPFTTDADLALDYTRLADSPLVEGAMRAAGFELGVDPGVWIRERIQVDLMVAEAQSGSGGRRGARIPPHGKNAARTARGLEASLVDNRFHEIPSFEQGDERSFSIRVAGPAALLVAKAIKIDERKDDPQRHQDKDALDILRILQAVPTRDLAETFGALVASDLAGDVAREAIEAVDALFRSPSSLGCEMAARATEGLVDSDEIRASLGALAGDLLEAVGEARGSGP